MVLNIHPHTSSNFVFMINVYNFISKLAVLSVIHVSDISIREKFILSECKYVQKSSNLFLMLLNFKWNRVSSFFISLSSKRLLKDSSV